MALYNIEKYWDSVALHIKEREGMQVIAGDDEPYYRYKRKKFLQLFDSIVFTNKRVLEVGSGPGGNLVYLSDKQCKEIHGVDISQEMIALATLMLNGKDAGLTKINGADLPFAPKHFDMVFTSTVLQHITDEALLERLVSAMCMVSASQVIIFERIEHIIKGHDTNIGRPVAYYKALFERNSFTLSKVQFLSIQASYAVCGSIRKVFNKRGRKEGEAMSKVSVVLQKLVLPFTALLDRIIPGKRDLAMLVFDRKT